MSKSLQPLHGLSPSSQFLGNSEGSARNFTERRIHGCVSSQGHPSIDPSIQPTAHDRAGGRITTHPWTSNHHDTFFSMVGQHPAMAFIQPDTRLHERALHGKSKENLLKVARMISLGSLFDMVAAQSIIDTQSKTSMSRESMPFENSGPISPKSTSTVQLGANRAKEALQPWFSWHLYSDTTL